MSDVKLIKAADRSFDLMGDGPGGISIHHDVSTAESTTMGCSVVSLEDCHMEWTVIYDEYMYCVDGSFTIRTREGDHVLNQGRRHLAAQRHLDDLHGRGKGHRCGRRLPGRLEGPRRSLRRAGPVMDREGRSW